jgi:hypothetical protein
MPKYVRLFKTLEYDIKTLEQEINAWVDATGAEIISVSGNVAPQTSTGPSSGSTESDVLVVVLYRMSPA